MLVLIVFVAATFLITARLVVKNHVPFIYIHIHIFHF